MPKYVTNSWQARNALANREPYTTGGAMKAIAGGFAWATGRLNEEWTERYRDDVRNEKVVYTVVSYSTPIAWVLDDGTVVKVSQKFSRTTSGHQGLLYALDAPRETRGAIDEAADRERQTARDRAAERREGIRSYGYNPGRIDQLAPVARPMGAPFGPTYEEQNEAARHAAEIHRGSPIYPNATPVRMEYSESYSAGKGWAH